MMPGPSRSPFSAVNCPDCGQMMSKAQYDKHSCSPEQYEKHQAKLKEERIKLEQKKWADEIRDRLDKDLEDYVASNRGQFILFLVQQGKI